MRMKASIHFQKKENLWEKNDHFYRLTTSKTRVISKSSADTTEWNNDASKFYFGQLNDRLYKRWEDGRTLVYVVDNIVSSKGEELLVLSGKTDYGIPEFD